ncbi:MAG: F0F1 ATP synthase subunit B [Alphaproteobacteria bacterium]|nr:F0F1 ATP synthase subunit B [Alphaproteobacteria bacterium]
MDALMHSTTFWVAVAFSVFVIAAFKPGKRVLTQALDSRIAKIREEVEEAQRLREEAQTMLASYQRRQREAIQEATQIVAHAREEAERAKVKAEAELEESIARREQQAALKIAQAEAAALEEIREKAVDMAIQATAKLLEKSMAGKAGEQAVTNAINDLPGKLH